MIHSLVALSLLAAPPAAGGSVDERDLAFLRTLAETKNFTSGRPVSVQLTPDGKTALFLRASARDFEQRLYAFDLATAALRELASNASVAAAETLSAEERSRRERMRISARGIVGFELSRDGAQALFSLGGKAFLVPVAGGKAREVAGPGPKGEPLFDAHLSPDGQSVGFVRGGELWVGKVGAAAHPVTSGAGGHVTHAVAEFVAQEELSRYRGWWWSPDSKELLFEEADSSFVEQLWPSDPARLFEPVEPAAYPRPGKPNVKVRFGFVSPAGGGVRWLRIDPRWEYVARVVWGEHAPLTLVLLSRDQRELAVGQMQPDGSVRELLRERDDAWVNSNQGLPLGGSAGERDLHFLSGGRFLWSSEKNGAWQLFLHSAEGREERALVPPDFGLVQTVAVDEARGEAVVLRAPDPLTLELWRVPLDGRPPQAMTRGGHTGAVFARGSPAHARLVTPAQGAPRWELWRADGTRAGELPSVAEPLPFDVRAEVRRVGDSGPPATGSGPTGFWTLTVKPRDLQPGRKYPVLLQVYGGPQHNEVRFGAAQYLVDQWIADHGFVVVHADGRGTPLRGRAWERAIQNGFAEVPLHDQVAALQALAAQDPSLDLHRVAVKGHSFGGFLAALAVLRRPDVFRAGVAGAPVVDWLNYDTTYTERYLGVPPPAGTSTAYAKNGLLPYAPDLRRPLLLLHGTADDNVHFSESLLLLDAVFKAGRASDIDFVPMVAQTHMFVDPALVARYWERVFAFLRTNLAEAPREGSGP